MDAHQIRIFGQMLACNARVLGMHAANEHRRILEQSPAYDEQHFFDEAMALEQLSRDRMLE